MTPEENLEHKRALSRARSQKYYDAKQSIISQRRKDIKKQRKISNKEVTKETIEETIEDTTEDETIEDITEDDVTYDEVYGDILYSDELTYDNIILKLSEDVTNERTMIKYKQNVKTLFKLLGGDMLDQHIRNYEKTINILDNSNKISEPTEPYSASSRKEFIKAL